jgi:beta-lactamase regulating signal transducer with metallopeptidase domain
MMREAARLTAGALVAGLWQGILLCIATGLLLKAIPKSTAPMRFVVWAAVFCVSVAMPFMDIPGTASVGRAEAATASHLVFDARWSYLLAALWVVAAAYRLGQLVFEAVGLRSLWKSAVPVAGEALAGLDVPLLVAGRRVELCTSDDVDRPSVIGFFAPRILVPTWLLTELTAIELNHVVLHELEHLRRRDDWVNLLQKIGLVLLPLNPALFWIDRRLSIERELACDDGVLEQTKMPRAYAASLTSIAERRLELRLRPRMGALALAVTGLRLRRSELVQRIESILGRRSPVNQVFAGGLAAVLLVGLVGSAAGLAHAPQLVSFESGDTMQASVKPVFLLPKATSPMVVASNAAAPIARIQNVRFRQPVGGKVAKPIPVVHAPVRAIAAQQISETRIVTPQRQLVVLTSWEDAPVSRVVVQTPDGRFFLAPYAAVPTQAGWLLVQL